VPPADKFGMDRGATILLIDDDAQVRTLLSRLLKQDGYETVEATDAPTAMSVVVNDQPDLVLLDVIMPNIDGIDLLQQIRAASDVAVIMLTGLGNEADRVLGLRMGADDYVVKPFSPGELTARIESVLRRARPAVARPDPDHESLEIDAAARDVHVRGQLVDLTAKEFDLLVFLAASPRQVFTRDQLLGQVWASSSEWQDPATVTEHVRRLRLKLEKDPERPELLRTVRGVGYRFEP
jgi:two-component system, OmpR family, phosphate regulon response regulator PhoB